MIGLLSYRGSSGKIYKLNHNLGEGGEGIVYGLLDDDKHVAKIYKENYFKTKSERDTAERKLKAMVAMQLSGYVDDKLRFTWPQDILYEDDEELGMVGFIMPRVPSSLKIYSVYRMDDAVKKIYPEFTWKYSLQFAYHLAWVVQYLHSKDIVVGDFNQNNIYVDTDTKAVVLIDCDSFDITDPYTREHFPCTVGFSEVLAPELQTVGNVRNGRFTKESDNFSLAIHIFRLLMRNADPFGGIIASGASTSSIPQNQAIINGECQYVRNVGKIIPKWSPKLEAMPVEIQELFKKTFDYTATTALRNRRRRATAEEWCNALRPYTRTGQNRRLKQCSHDPLHIYASHNRRCPWCVCEGKTYVPDPIDLNHLKKAFQILSRVLQCLMVLSILSELGYLGYLCLYRSTGDYRTMWSMFCKNVLIIRENLLGNPLFLNLGYFKLEIEIFADKFAQFCSNLDFLRRSDLGFICGKNFLENNQLVIHHSVEQFWNVSVMIPVLIGQIKNLFGILQNNTAFYLGMVMKKIKGLIPIWER